MMIPVDPQETRAPRRAVDVIRHGGVVAVPTDTVYGLAANALDAAAVARVFAIKGRPPDEPMPVLIADTRDADRLAVEIPAAARDLMDRFWPGALTLVLRRNLAVPAIVSAGRMTIALRVPDLPVLRALIRAAGVPLTGTSANPHGLPAPISAAQVATTLDEAVDLILDGGITRGPIPSTVLDLTTTPPRVVRDGVIPARDLVLAAGVPA